MAVAWAAFIVVVAVWAVFGYFLVASPQALTDAWEWVRQQNVLVQGVAWLLGLPWMLALLTWQSAWVVWAKLVIIAGLAVATVSMFAPWRR